VRQREAEVELDHKISTLTPVLTVDPIEDAVEFYQELGFSEVFSIPDENGRVVHSHLRKGESAMFLGRPDISHYPGKPRAVMIANSTASQRGTGITLLLQVDNLAAIYEMVQRRKLEVLAEPADEFYGDRVFFFLDPFGYEWKISQPTAG
jgi:PhnB protein